ncbi:capping protein-inhibiting regulator of actin dynamics isoform X3 [Synchiropus splendidus]|uniref:capping protein-inhibiting regulator of actin dynamics isoform X3 n=1 Tax=Synchiropus splendidus TaxID=270530 RepID=UPI00237E987F|nr:capping protein-inhibiting regulator of actin dynamics isoform X3 [Synchiropus splendidus]XP_053734866.1 capping protein-inhibiting regulator of actin dynamics isoform X3 [Synchiropus splendidus]XP_053734867.1 capping protein-inhibiting regulator of actin dynamics isoform X3 [Synchiropus splendidus]
MKRRMSPWRASFGGNQSGDSVAMASDTSEVMVNHDPTETNEECSGKKKSKFKNFKKFFVRKKRKEPVSHGVESELVASKSSDNVSKSSGNALSCSDKEKGSKVSLGSKALSHDSVFVSDSSEANEALGASQDSIHGKVKSLQLHLKQAIRLGTPPSIMCVKRTEDTGTMSDDDGLPCSPPEYTATTQVQRDSSASLDSEDEQVNKHSCRVENALVVIPADFSQPASPFACLDNSAAKHKLGLRQKACNKRKPANRLEVQAECNSTLVKNHVVPFPKSLDEEETEKTPDTCEDEPNMEKKQLEEPSLPGNEETEHESEISHCPDTSGLPESDPSGEAADHQLLSSPRASTPDSPCASTASPADQKMDLDTAETSERGEDRVLGVGVDDPKTLEESREERAASVGEDDHSAPEESTFLEEVLTSLKTPHTLVIDSVGLLNGCEEKVETEDLVKQRKMEDETDGMAATAMTADDGGGDEEYSEDLEEAEEEVEADEEEVNPEAGDERETDEEEKMMKCKGEVPDSHQDIPSGSSLSCESSEENKTASTTVCHTLGDEEELSEDEDVEDEEEEPEVELFMPFGQKDKDCTEEPEEPGLFQTQSDVEEAGSNYSDKEDVKVDVDSPEEGVKEEQDDSVVEQEMTTFGLEKVGVDEELEDDEWGRKDEEEQLEAWERQMLDAGRASLDFERDEGTAEQNEMLVEPFSDKEETCVVLEHQDDGDDCFIESDEPFPTQQGAHEEEEEPPAELDEQTQQLKAEMEATQPDQEEQMTVNMELLQETEKIQSSVPEPSATPVPESQSGDLSPSIVSATVSLQLFSPNSEKSAEPEVPESSSALVEVSQEQCFRTSEEKSPISEGMIEEEWHEGQLCLDAVSPNGPGRRKVRFTIATAWQRSLSSEGSGEASFSPPPSNITSEPAATSLPDTMVGTRSAPVEPESSGSGRVESIEGTFSKSQDLIQASKDSSVKVEGTDNPFGVKLRKTSVRSRLSQEEEVPAESNLSKVESPQSVSDKSLIQPITKKPALPNKPDLHGDSVVKTRRISEPASVCSGASDGPSWISVAKQKQKLYKDHSLNEITIKKEEHDRKSSLPIFNASATAGEHRHQTSDKVISMFSSLAEKEGRWVMTPPTPVPPVSSKSIPAPSGSRPLVSPAAPKALPHQDVSPVLSKLTHPLSLSTTPNLPASRVAPGPTVTKTPALTSQRGIPPPALPQNEPPWMALAKKKAKAWSEMPQIVQ